MSKYIRITRSAAVFAASAFFLIMSGLSFGFDLPEHALSHANPRVREVITVQESFTPELMAIEDVIGTAVGLDDTGDPSVVVYVNIEGKNPAANAKHIPVDLLGKKVKIEFTDPFVSMFRPVKGQTVSHTAKQTAPIQLGTSGGWRYDLANGYCCGGTLGALVNIGVDQYILSNYHVLESDIVSGGNSRTAADGDPVMQPGLIDVSCNTVDGLNVGTLVKKDSLPNSNVDASVAKVKSGMVRTDGSILEIGSISGSTVPAAINQAVKKSGRTTGLTSSTVSGLNATVSVTYDNECAGGIAFTKTFTGQIIVGNRASKFLKSGDSGSLMVENVPTKPRAVGLLFAGSSSFAVANPIEDVLNFLSATMVGY